MIVRQSVPAAGISQLTLGTVQLGLNYGVANQIGKPDFERASALLDEAVRQGINSFDTAAEYGDSEVVLGTYFAAARLPRESWRVTTKFKLGESELADPNQIEGAIRRSTERSLKRLQLDRLPILMLHDPRQLCQCGSRLAMALEHLISEGLIGQAAVSIYRGAEMDACLAEPVYSAVQIPLNLLDQRLIRDGRLERLRQSGLTVFVRSVYLQGLFFAPDERIPASIQADAKPLLAQLRQIAAAAGMPVAQLAFAFVRDLPGVTSLVIGAETAEQVRDNAALLAAPALTTDMRQKLAHAFAAVPERVVNPALWF